MRRTPRSSEGGCRRGNDYVGEAASANSRTPFAHPEGFIEAFANIYLAAAGAIADQIEGNDLPAGGYDFPIVDDGVAGNAFNQGLRGVRAEITPPGSG